MSAHPVAAYNIIPVHVRHLIGGMDGADMELYGQYLKLTKGNLVVLLQPPRTCIILKKAIGQEKPMLFPRVSIASHHCPAAPL